MKIAIKHVTAAALLFAFILGVPASITAQKRHGKGAAAAPTFGNANAITAREVFTIGSRMMSTERYGPSAESERKSI